MSRLLRDHPHALFVFSDADRERWHFVNVKQADDATRRTLYRRFTVGKGERLRTTAERVDLLRLHTTGLQSPLEIQEQHDQAFDVEAVQKQFFQEFARLHGEFADEIAKVRGLKEQAPRLAQQLLDRMLFLYFIQKKGWLAEEPEYLYSRFRDHYKREPRGTSYYGAVLQPLFCSLSDPTRTVNREVGPVPFLNGGLFEECASQEQRVAEARIEIKNATFKSLFDDLLERFNFTVTEDTPLDVEVAIDPEMLGKIFESLVLQEEKEPGLDLRKMTGSYYTPRPIVHFMCQEALKEHLLSRVADRAAETSIAQDAAAAGGATVRDKLDTLFALPPANQLDDDEARHLSGLFSTEEARRLKQAILACRVCDPAVGSGAFPVGMLHEMVAAVARLDRIIGGPNAIAERSYEHRRKREIIESCLYGVDIQEQAVRLCELRLWLSLVVDYQLEPGPFKEAIQKVPALPNLSYHIVRGDSLLERMFGHVVQLDELAKDGATSKLIGAITDDKRRYFDESRSDEKRRLEAKILAQQANLAERLVVEKRRRRQQVNLNMFGESAKDRKAREAREAQDAALADLEKKIHRAKEALDKLAETKPSTNTHDIETLRRTHFQAGDAPTFLWRVDFAEVFAENGGFDIVIANPPYVRVHRLSEELKHALWSSFSTFEAKADLYTCFIERAIQLARPQTGNICFICSDGWQRLDSYVSLRDHILAATVPRLLVDLRFDVFEEAQVKVSVFQLLRRTPPAGPMVHFAPVTRLGDLETTPRSRIPVRAFKDSFNHIFDTSWSPESERIMTAMRRMSVKLGDLLDVSFGLKTGDDSQFLVERAVDKYHKRLLRGENVSRYRIEWAGEYVNYRPDLMRAHRPTARPGERERFECEKVLVRDTGEYLECALDTDCFYVKDVLIVRPLEAKFDTAYAAALINSLLLRWYYERAFPTLHVQAAELRSLPIIPPSRKGVAARRIAKLARERQLCVDGKKGSVIEEQIDAEVFALYEIDAADVDLIRRQMSARD